jgi:CMP-N,N'-diacetyllegionaminic acid synthase
MKILGIIPARGGSKGIPRKNIRLLNGVPLIGHTIRQALNSKLLDKLIVSTDDEEIAKYSVNQGVDVPFLRPDFLSNSSAKSIDVIIHALEFFEQKGEHYDAICLLQPTSPFRPSGVIDSSINMFKSRNVDSLISVRKTPSHYNPFWNFVCDSNSVISLVIPQNEIIPRRQNLPDTFVRDGAIYLTSTDLIKTNRSFFSHSTIGFEICSPELVNIDNEVDWEQASIYMKQCY